MALPIKLVSKARHRVGPSGYCHEDLPIFAWRPTLAFFVAFHLEFPPVRSAPDSGRSTGNFDPKRPVVLAQSRQSEARFQAT